MKKSATSEKTDKNEEEPKKQNSIGSPVIHI